MAVIAGFFVSVIYLLIVMSFENTIDLFGTEKYGLKLLGFFTGVVILGIVCYIDDVKGIPSLTKLAAQILAAIIVVMSGIRIENFTLPFTDDKIMFNEVFSYILTVGWIVGITNAINLIDRT